MKRLAIAVDTISLVPLLMRSERVIDPPCIDRFAGPMQLNLSL